jgi:30S ribosomal protein S31
MGKGDKKTRKGKINIGSYGVRRKRKGKKISALTDKKVKTKPVKAQEPKPRKVAEEPALVVETPVVVEQAVINEPEATTPVQAEIPLDITPAKAPVKKIATKKTAAKTEKQEKPEAGEAKPKTTKGKKKTAESAEEKEKPTEE